MEPLKIEIVSIVPKPRSHHPSQCLPSVRPSGGRRQQRPRWPSDGRLNHTAHQRNKRPALTKAPKLRRRNHPPSQSRRRALASTHRNHCSRAQNHASSRNKRKIGACEWLCSGTKATSQQKPWLKDPTLIPTAGRSSSTSTESPHLPANPPWRRVNPAYGMQLLSPHHTQLLETTVVGMLALVDQSSCAAKLRRVLLPPACCAI